MLRIFLIGIGITAITVVLHAVGTTAWVAYLGRRYPGGKGLARTRTALAVLTLTVIIAIGLHAVQISLWAVSYLVMLPSGELHSLEEALYFSIVTFTSLGYGDITLSEGWRMLSGIEALSGILLLGWTTALLFAVVQRTWKAASSDGSQQQ